MARLTGGNGSEPGPSAPQTTPFKKGKVKWFNITKGFGFITPQDGSQEVFVHQSVIKMPGFRCLAEDELVDFTCRQTDKGLEATFVSGPGGANCTGIQDRQAARKKKMRCYNCGQFENHLAEYCPSGPLPKSCYYCRSGSHLVANCPHKPPR